jgi:succinate dehydrogenase / fumarate reductase flavoprotein subunit
MQGLADGYFVLPYTIGSYLQRNPHRRISTDTPEFDRPKKKCATASNTCMGVQRQTKRGKFPPPPGQDHVGQMRHGPQRRRP